MICGGIDAGSRTIKIVLIEAESRQVIAKGVTDQGVEQNKLNIGLFERLLKDNSINKEDIHRTVATGYGRNIVSIADTTVTEITCQAVGVRHLVPEVKTIIDIGGQDNKIIKINGSGKRTGFKMNRKCAAGTGAFLEEIANRLKIKLQSFNDLAEKATKNIQIGSYCTVFTATEILAKIREDIDIANIIKGIFDAVIKRAVEMDPLEGNIVMSGGVAAYNPYLVKMFEKKIGKKIFVPHLPQLTGALGAALYAFETKGV